MAENQTSLVPWPLCETNGCEEMLTSDEEIEAGICDDCADPINWLGQDELGHP